MELCLLNLLILNDWFLCNSYHCVLFKTLSHVINQESHVSSWNLGKIYLVHFLKFWNFLRFYSPTANFVLLNLIWDIYLGVGFVAVVGVEVKVTFSLKSDRAIEMIWNLIGWKDVIRTFKTSCEWRYRLASFFQRQQSLMKDYKFSFFF